MQQRGRGDRVRPPVEHYVRCTVKVGELVIEPGLELREDDDFERLSGALALLARCIGAQAAVTRRAKMCSLFAPVFEAAWPGRAWFVELHDARLARWTQSYQPFGIPRRPRRSSSAGPSRGYMFPPAPPAA